MRGLPTLLLLLVVGTHYGYDLAASFYPSPAEAGRALFYIFRGIEGTMLYLIVWSLTPFEPRAARLAVSTMCAWGALESIQTSLCRIAIGVTNNVNSKPYSGLCDLVTGLPVYMGTLLIVLVIFAYQRTKGG